MTSYSIGRTILRYMAIAGTSFTLAVLAQSVYSSLAWALLGLGVAAWVASSAVAIIKQGDDSWAMVGVTMFGMFGALVGVGEILARLPWAQLALPILGLLIALCLFVGIERFISGRKPKQEVNYDFY